MRDRRDRGAALPAQPARRAGPADRRDGRDGAVARRRASRRWSGAPRRSPSCRARRWTRCWTCWPGATRPTRSPSCGRGWSGTGSTGELTARAGRAAARGDQRRHDPRPRPVRRVPGRRRRPGSAGRRTRRGDGLRVAGRRRVPARLVVVADRGHHPRPGAGHPGARRSRPDAVLEGRRARPPGRAGPRARARSCASSRTRRPTTAPARARAAGLDAWGADNLLAYLGEQREATGQLPDDRTVLVERFRDELGDWRLVVHSPFGAPVNAPWALAIAARLRERYGVDVQAMHSDDGIVLRLPDTDAEPPGAELVGLRAGRDRAAGHRRGRRVGAVRLPVPRVRRPRAAAAAPRPAPAHPAVAAAPAGHPAARGGPRVRRLPDRAGGGARVPAGRVRRARPGRR